MFQSADMYKLDIIPDQKEHALIERRRAQEEARKGRIFNAKYRIIGVIYLIICSQIILRLVL